MSGHERVITAEQAAAVRAAVMALPPMTDEQIAAVCEVIVTSRARWQREIRP
jgi:hypothetical protein